MALSFPNLDETTRQFMLEEIEHDIAENKLYYSSRLSPAGKQLYPDILRRAASKGTNLTFAGELRVPGRLNKTEERKGKGGTAIAQMPMIAPDMLAEGEFNRFYMRGLCRRAQAQGIESLVIYRMKEGINPRPELADLVGRTVPVNQLLENLRANSDVDTALELPPGSNSGLSVKLPVLE